MKRAERRRRTAVIKKRRKSRFTYHYVSDNPRHQAVQLETPCICSCCGCGNPRKHFKVVTRQEVLAEMDIEEYYKEEHVIMMSRKNFHRDDLSGWWY